jgi:predicted enzyme related to lactoylglutathione lyase
MENAPLGPVAQVALPVRDLAAATAFYRDALGLPLKFEAGGMAFFSAGNVTLMLGPPSAPEIAQSGGVIYFGPDDVLKAAAMLKERGVKFRGEPAVVQRTETTELQIHVFQDPDGNYLALMGHVPVSHAARP